MKSKNWSEEDLLFLRQNYVEKGSLYCAQQLSRTRASIRRKAEAIGATNERHGKYDRKTLVEAVAASANIMEVVRKTGRSAGGGTHNIVKKYIKQYAIDTSHFETQADRARKIRREPVPLTEVLVENSTYGRTELKARLYKEGLKERKCELCGQGEEWQGKRMSLILDHINGVNNDNRLPNLRIVCPNCNATLETHAGRNVKNKKKCIDCGAKVAVRGTRCKPCLIKSESFIQNAIKRRKVKERPTQEQLTADIAELGYLGTGRKYGVSDNAIRKWEKTFSTSKSSIL